jgi:hypothetical protein
VCRPYTGPRGRRHPARGSGGRTAGRCVGGIDGRSRRSALRPAHGRRERTEVEQKRPRSRTRHRGSAG